MAGPKLPKRAEAGITIGGYELVRRIGRGGMAEVWVARKALGKKGTKFVAIKLIADHHVGDERYARMFRSEAELAAVLSHANIVQVFDEGEDDGRSYLIMEWVDGLNLLKLGDMLALLDDEQRRFRVISYIIGQLLHALHYAHSITSHDGSPLGVVHRDVSPQNVLVSNHGEVKLTDFGVAYYNIEESSGIHVKGKVRYMSPEQLSGKTRSPTVDLYAVGALLHELLDGRKFRGEFDDGQDLFTVVLSGHVSALSRYVPPELDRLRLGLLEPDPERRIQSAEHAIAWLKQYPDYGDARDELTKLCGSLTGVVRPRVGPGQSSQVAAADQATTRWGGRNPLAKPKVDVAPARLVPAKPLAKPPVPPQRTGSTTAVKGPTEAEPQSEALITGHTEFIKPQSLPGMAPPSQVSTVAPTAPLSRVGLRALLSEPMAQPMVPPSSPLGVHPQPHASANGAPPYVPAQGSHPIQVQAAPGWPAPGNAGIPPTQLLAQSEISGVGPHAVSTDVLDGQSVAELRAGSGTDRDILPVRAAGDGSDTRQEIPGRMPTRSNSAIARPQSSAVAVIGVGLLMVAVMSVSLTWYLFTRGKDEEVKASSLAASAVESKAKPEESKLEEPKPEESKPEESKSSLAAKGEPEVEVDPEEPPPSVDDQGSPEIDGAAEPPTPTPTAEDAANTKEAPVPTAETADTKKEEEPEPADDAKPSGAEPPKPKPLPKSMVKIFNNTGSAKAQVKLGSETFSASDKSEHKITAGKRAIKWRKSPTDPWQAAGSWSFKSGQRFSVYVTQTGATVRIST